MDLSVKLALVFGCVDTGVAAVVSSDSGGGVCVHTHLHTSIRPQIRGRVSDSMNPSSQHPFTTTTTQPSKPVSHKNLVVELLV